MSVVSCDEATVVGVMWRVLQSVVLLPKLVMKSHLHVTRENLRGETAVSWVTTKFPRHIPQMSIVCKITTKHKLTLVYIAWNVLELPYLQDILRFAACHNVFGVELFATEFYIH